MGVGQRLQIFSSTMCVVSLLIVGRVYWINHETTHRTILSAAVQETDSSSTAGPNGRLVLLLTPSDCRGNLAVVEVLKALVADTTGGRKSPDVRAVVLNSPDDEQLRRDLVLVTSMDFPVTFQGSRSPLLAQLRVLGFKWTPVILGFDGVGALRFALPAETFTPQQAPGLAAMLASS